MRDQEYIALLNRPFSPLYYITPLTPTVITPQAKELFVRDQEYIALLNRPFSPLYYITPLTPTVITPQAKELFVRDQEYIVNKADGTINIVDAFSGRVLEGRRFTDGLQQSIEAKENVLVSGETQVVARVTYQNLFRLFPRLSGMTGTAFTEAQEFLEVWFITVLHSNTTQYCPYLLLSIPPTHPIITSSYQY